MNTIKSARKAQGLTQQQLADKMGRAKSYVSKYENEDMLPATIKAQFKYALGGAKIDVEPNDIITFAYANDGDHDFTNSPTLETAYGDEYITPGNIKLPAVPKQDDAGGWPTHYWSANQHSFYADSLLEYINQHDDFYYFIEAIRDTAGNHGNHDLFEAVEETAVNYIWEYSIRGNQIGTWITQAEYDKLTSMAGDTFTKAVAALWLDMDRLYNAGKAEMQLWGVQDMLAACRDEDVTYPAHDITNLGRQK